MVGLLGLFGRRERARETAHLYERVARVIPPVGRQLPSRIGQSIEISVAQDGNRFSIRGDGIDIYFSVEGPSLPSGTDPSFAVWGLLPRAMEEGIDLCFDRPIDPQVAANAERVSQIWEMWVPSRYRSISVKGTGEWSRPKRSRLPRACLYSGGVDATFSILRNGGETKQGFAVTTCVHKVDEDNISELITKTEPFLENIGYERIVIRTNVKWRQSSLSHGFTLASALFLLSDLFEEGTLAADCDAEADMVIFPWGSNHLTNQYFRGSDFFVNTLDADVGRTEKLAKIVNAGVYLNYLSFCTKKSAIPSNCGRCNKCIWTKAMFLVVTGSIPEIFIDNSFDEATLNGLIGSRIEQVDLFDLYRYAKSHGYTGRIPSLPDLVEKCRV